MAPLKLTDAEDYALSAILLWESDPTALNGGRPAVMEDVEDPRCVATPEVAARLELLGLAEVRGREIRITAAGRKAVE